MNILLTTKALFFGYINVICYIHHFYFLITMNNGVTFFCTYVESSQGTEPFFWLLQNVCTTLTSQICMQVFINRNIQNKIITFDIAAL